MPEIERAALSIVRKLRLSPPGWLPAAGMLLVLPLLALADVVQLAPSKDNTLYENAGGDFSNGAGEFLFAGQTGTMGSSKLRRAVLEFNLASIPSGSVVNSVTVELTVDKAPDEDATTDLAHLHRLLAEWGEGTSDAGSPGGTGEASSAGDASWIHTFYASAFWTTAGGDYDPTASATYPFGNFAPETFTFQSASLLGDVQGWVENPASNHGWILLADENTPKNARRFYSRESADTNPGEIPLLTVDFTPPSVTDHLSLTLIASGLSGPIGIVNAGDGSGRLFIIEQAGIIRIYDTIAKTLLVSPFLDITSRVGSSLGEKGLLGLVFHPDYASNGKFFVYYTYAPGPGLVRSRLAQYQVSVGDANVAGTAETVLMEFEQDAANHNGGDMHFGTDGYLYIAVGDGGGSNDQYGHAQDVHSLKGKMLRIDVDSTPAGAEKCGLVANYAIPAGNPFNGASDGCDEILHFGLRNPWRFSFDALTGEMMIGDVGQNLWEEIDYAAPGAAGINFGWSCREGAHNFAGNACVSAYTDPVIEYSSAGGTTECSVTGGYVYRGSALPLQGRYVYGDYCSERIWIAERTVGSWISEEWIGPAATLSSITSFGQDEQCNLYVADRNDGKIYRIDDSEFIQSSGFETLNCR